MLSTAMASTSASAAFPVSHEYRPAAAAAGMPCAFSSCNEAVEYGMPLCQDHMATLTRGVTRPPSPPSGPQTLTRSRFRLSGEGQIKQTARKSAAPQLMSGASRHRLPHTGQHPKSANIPTRSGSQPHLLGTPSRRQDRASLGANHVSNGPMPRQMNQRSNDRSVTSAAGARPLASSSSSASMQRYMEPVLGGASEADHNHVPFMTNGVHSSRSEEHHKGYGQEPNGCPDNLNLARDQFYAPHSRLDKNGESSRFTPERVAAQPSSNSQSKSYNKQIAEWFESAHTGGEVPPSFLSSNFFRETFKSGIPLPNLGLHDDSFAAAKRTLDQPKSISLRDSDEAPEAALGSNATRASASTSGAERLLGQDVNGVDGNDASLAKDGQCRIAEFDQERFEIMILAQKGAPTFADQIARRGSAINLRDPPFFAHIDPRTHWTQQRSKAWHQRKEREIKARGGRKANFGKAAQRMAERERKEQEERDDDDYESDSDKLPECVESNPQWKRALKWFAECDSGGRGRERAMPRRDQIQEQLERDAQSYSPSAMEE